MKTTWLEPEIVMRRGKPISVILPIKRYEELLERLEDAEDVALLKRTRHGLVSYGSLEEYLTNHKHK